jgi:hypothetical protein
MNVGELYDILDKMFVLKTTRQWKNGWVHEGDVLSKELTIQKEVKWNNLFLLQKNHRFGNEAIHSFYIDGPNGFKIEVQKEVQKIRIDIESNIHDINIYYYVDNELDWDAHKLFIINLCQNIYDKYIGIDEVISDVPSKVYGVINPNFAIKHKRNNLLEKIGI